jgi:hypothetical protein
MIVTPLLECLPSHWRIFAEFSRCVRRLEQRHRPYPFGWGTAGPQTPTTDR